MLLDVFRTICRKQVIAFNNAMDSDLYMGINIALDEVIEQLAELPELENVPEVQSAKARIKAGYPAV